MADKDGDLYKNQDDKLTSGQRTKLFIWNPRTKEFLGRTGGSWAKLCVFYLIFYTCLAAFWAVMLLIFYQTIDYREPKWQLSESRIGTNPGLGFRPRPPKDKVESTLIWFNSGGAQSGNWKHWSEDLTTFLEPYDTTLNPQTGEHLQECDKNQKQPEKGKFCKFDLRQASSGTSCTKENNFGYNVGTPCVLIKLNRIFNWRPEPYKSDSVPKELSRLMENRTRDLSSELDNIIITCEGENPADKEAIGVINYSKNGLINFNNFPYTNQPGYLSPFVFVEFKGPTKGTLINIECKAWAANIRHDRMDREGSVHFELLID